MFIDDWIGYWTWWMKIWMPPPAKVVRPRFNRVPREWHPEKAPVIPLKRAA